MKDYNQRSKNVSTTSEPFQVDLSALTLPSIIRYHDDFADRIRTIQTHEDDWAIICDGRKSRISWEGYSAPAKSLLQHYIAWGFTKYDPSTFISLGATIEGKKQSVEYWLQVFSYPETTRNIWEKDGFRQLKQPIPFLLRSISVFLCEMSLCGWSPDDLQYLKGWKWFAPKNKSLVEHGLSYYLSQEEETKLVSYFDHLALNIKADIDTTRDALLLYFSYSFGLRPVQIAGITRSDVNIVEVDGKKLGHITFFQAKQMSGKREPILRKIKRDWTSILLDYINIADELNEERSDLVHNNSFFNLTPNEASTRISNITLALIGRHVTPTLFRHIAAQRMADLGMSQLELAEFLGHSDKDTCLIYFENSAIQGQIINRALGLSPIYQKIRDIAEYGFITHEELDELADDQQIGGAAHGILLAGIGGCAIGQSLCELSPAISCYTCPKFLPLHNIDTNKKVAEDLRDVVEQFEQSGRNDQSNPAYTQLSYAMTKISNIIMALESTYE